MLGNGHYKAPVVEPGSPIPMQWAGQACLDLVNSTWADHLGSGATYDRLPLPDFQRWFLGRWHLELDRPIDMRALKDLAQLRTLLRQHLLDWAAGKRAGGHDLERLDKALLAAPLVRRIRPSGAGLLLEPVRRDLAWLKAELVVSCLELMARGDPRRLKVCANEACTWMFYDDSPNRSRRFCTPLICGNLVHVRRFRGARRLAAGRRKPSRRVDPKASR